MLRTCTIYILWRANITITCNMHMVQQLSNRTLNVLNKHLIYSVYLFDVRAEADYAAVWRVILLESV